MAVPTTPSERRVARKRKQRADAIAAVTSGTLAPTPRGRGRPRVEKPPSAYQLAAEVLRAKWPTLDSLPEIFCVDVLADCLPGLPAKRRRAVASRWLSEIGAVALGTFLRGQSFAMWARTAASCRGMSKTEIMSTALGPESKAFPPQRIPSSFGDWRKELKRLLPHTRARGFVGPAHKQWGWSGPVRKAPVVAASS